MAQEHYPDCIICKSPTAYYFSKTYAPYQGSPYADAFKVDYGRCSCCGFVLSETHRTMPEAMWTQLNESCHHEFEDPEAAKIINQPPYANQGLALAMLHKNGIVRLDDALDYAAGYGTLAQFLDKYLGLGLKIFDRYVHNPGQGVAYVGESELGRYALVINSAMFEHVRGRASLDEVNALVADDGVLMIHTVICERVPPDPNWFYLNTIVHTAFHTNRSSAMLMEQWGYAASIYCPLAKSWFLFKKDYPLLDRLEAMVGAINREVQAEHFIYKLGFVDYWKGF